MAEDDLVNVYAGPDLGLSTLSRDARVAGKIHKLSDTLQSTALHMRDSPYDHQSLRLTFRKVIVALATLQSSVQDLSRAYINHANTVLNPGRAGTLDLGLASSLLENGLLPQRPTNPEIALAEPPELQEKKKRKRAAHDPNAPKRALTPYFLYMQSARSQIARELGPNAKPKEVADEGTRRWSEMKDEDKSVSDEAFTNY